jgi:hypothetical protein
MTVPTAMRRAASWRRIGLWLAVAAACWLAARACERHTLLSIVSTGSRIEVTADAHPSRPPPVDSIRRIEVVATTSAFAPANTLTAQGPHVLVGCRRFKLCRASGAVGDWEIDDHAGTGLGCTESRSHPVRARRRFTGPSSTC